MPGVGISIVAALLVNLIGSLTLNKAMSLGNPAPFPL